MPSVKIVILLMTIVAVTLMTSTLSQAADETTWNTHKQTEDADTHTTNPGSIVVSGPNFDGDLWMDSNDNCIEVPNNNQRNTNTNSHASDPFGNICDPDFNHDGIVNFLDIAHWAPFFPSVCGNIDEDLNGDGNCDFADFFIIVNYFLLPPGP